VSECRLALAVFGIGCRWWWRWRWRAVYRGQRIWLRRVWGHFGERVRGNPATARQRPRHHHRPPIPNTASADRNLLTAPTHRSALTGQRSPVSAHRSALTATTDRPRYPRPLTRREDGLAAPQEGGEFGRCLPGRKPCLGSSVPVIPGTGALRCVPGFTASPLALPLSARLPHARQPALNRSASRAILQSTTTTQSLQPSVRRAPQWFTADARRWIERTMCAR